jgi:CRISPR-associated protein Cmr1
MKVALTLETVTPLFLGGVTQQPELRPASFRGALRYWYRALVGGIVGNDLSALQLAESKVFGNTEGSSPVTLRLRGAMSTVSTFDLDRDRGNALRNGHNYLFYSTRLGNNRRVTFAPRQSSSQSGITLTLSTRLGAYQGNIAVQYACAAAWLLTHLGGLGMRSRRCGGSLQVLEGSSLGLPDFAVTAQNTVGLQELLGGGLRQIRTLMGTSLTPSLDFDVLHPDVCRVWVIAGEVPWETWKEAVEAIGTIMQTFRAAQGKERNILNSIFGVPISHGPNHDLQRRASPLWLRVTKLASGEHVGVATLFKANFTAGRREVGGGYALIEQFIQMFPTHLEVTYR